MSFLKKFFPISVLAILLSVAIYTALPRETVEAVVPAGQKDLSFDTGEGSGFNNGVLALALQTDGKTIVGGGFSSHNGVSLNFITRINSDGSLDPTFTIGTGFNSTVEAISLQSDGKIIAVGNFTAYNGTDINRIVRLNTDGSLDTTFIVGTGFNSVVEAVSIQPDGKIVVGGTFTTFDGTSRNRIVRLNTDGSLDTTFVIGTGFNNRVATISIQPDEKIIVGGSFATYTGVSRSRIARLNADGSLDTTFVVGTGLSTTAESTYLQSDGKVIVGGNFISYNGTGTNRIARLNTDGTLDTTFNVGSGFDVQVYTLYLQPDGKVIVGGNFTTYNGTGINRIARLDTDGSLDTTFNVGSGLNNEIHALSLQPDGKVIVGGHFVSYDDVSIYRLARLNTDASLDTGFNSGSGFNNQVYELSLQPDGKIIIGGNFTKYNDTNINRLARLNSDGTLDTTFSVGNGLNNSVETIALQPDGKIIVGGNFTTYDDTSMNRIARLNSDGSLDTTFNVGSGFSGVNITVEILLLQPDGKVVVGGNFTTYNGTSINRIVRLDTDGSLDITFDVGSGFNSSASSLSLQSDGKVIVGGGFSNYNGTSINSIARLNTDGSLDTTFDVGNGFNDSIWDLEIQSDGKVITSGYYDSYDGVPSYGVTRLNTDGSLDNSFTVTFSQNSGADTVSVDSDGKILLGGWMTSDSHVTYDLFVRLNPDGSIDSTLDSGSGFNNNPSSIIVQSDESIILGGYFTAYNNIPTPYLVRLLPEQYQASNLTAPLGLIVDEESIVVGTENGSRVVEQAMLVQDSTLPISRFTVDFSEGDVDFSSVDAGIDLESGKSFIMGLNTTQIPQLGSTHSLIIPKLSGHNGVYICPDATSLAEVTDSCANGYLLLNGESEVLTVVTINDVEYWEVTGLTTGTGGMSLFSAPVDDVEDEDDDEVGGDEDEQDDLPETGINLIGFIFSMGILSLVAGGSLLKFRHLSLN